MFIIYIDYIQILPINMYMEEMYVFKQIAQIKISFKPRVTIHADNHIIDCPFPVIPPPPPCHITHESTIQKY